MNKKMSTVNLMFLEDVLEDIESNAKKMQQDINKNLHNLKNIQYEKEKEKALQEVVSSEEEDSDNYSEDALEIDSNSYDFGVDNRNESFESMSDEENICLSSPRMSIEEKKKKTAPRKLQRMDSTKSNKSTKSEGDVNAQPGNSPFKAHSFFVKKKTKACNKAV
jgi:hypothetical protein